ncbi:MAG: DUF2807 domain-containing protein [Bacteroidales bacterium]|nr:DUF2807 domain-containing protein [Bacteroidales bacterium]
MKKTAILLVLATILCSCVHININGGKTVKCGGDVVEQNMDFSGFTGVIVEGAAHIDFIQANTFLVQVAANEEVFNYLDYSMRGKNLVISTKDHVNINAKMYKVLIEAPVLRSINVEGAAEIHQPGSYKSEEGLEIDIDGAAKLEINKIEVPSLDITINGAGEFDISSIAVGVLEIEVNGAGSGSVSGVADYAKLSVAGTANIDARGLRCSNLEKKIEGFAVIR